MVNKGVIVLSSLVVGGVLVLALSGKAKAASGYSCPYCGETFDTLAELQAHVQSAHPGQRIPIDITWS